MREGTLTWKFDWYPGIWPEGCPKSHNDPYTLEPSCRPKRESLIQIQYDMIVHKLHVNRAAVRLRLYSPGNHNVTIVDVIEGTSAARTNHVAKSSGEGSSTIWSAVSPKNVENVTAYVVSTLAIRNRSTHKELETRPEAVDSLSGNLHESSVGQSVTFQLPKLETMDVTKYVGVASSDAFIDPKKTAMAASLAGLETGFDNLRESHIEEWKSIMTEDSVDIYGDLDVGIPKNEEMLQMAWTSISNTFMLLQNTVGPNAIAAADNNPRLNIHSIPVCGLGSDCYGGLIFWDAEAWMAPGLQMSHPRHIENVVNYRVAMYPQAKENVKTAFASSKNQTSRFTGGAVFPWTSGRFGNCTASGPCFDYEYHVNGGIGLALRNQFIATGDAEQFKEKFLPIMNDIAYFYGELVDYNETSGYYELNNATDPDEYANNVNNVAFTTALIQRHLNETNEFNSLFGLPQNETWNNISATMRLPVDKNAGIVKEYASMNGSIKVKQADVVLIDDILHYENPYSLVDLDYYANKQSADGPGMTYAVFSIVANEISPSGCSSYTYHHYASQPYARDPWKHYSEQLEDDDTLNGGTHPAFPFLTGMGGANRIGIFGYLGLRLFVDRLHIDPSIPPQIPRIDYRTFYWQGYGINATSNATHTILIRMPNRILDTANPAYAKNIPVTVGTPTTSYSLSIDREVVVPNRMLGQTLTVAGNVLQCKRVVYERDHRKFVPGQFPLAAIDGASSTKWQPQDPKVLNYISVDTSPSTYAPIHRILFDWGSVPPLYYEVFVSNWTAHMPWDLTEPFTPQADIKRVTSGWVEASEPWDPERALVIEPIKGNQTNVTLQGDERVWSGRYFHLGIKGNLADQSALVGGMVAEWSVILEERENEAQALSQGRVL